MIPKFLCITLSDKKSDATNQSEHRSAISVCEITEMAERYSDWRRIVISDYLGISDYIFTSHVTQYLCNGYEYKLNNAR
jgi:hypothetical protein